MAAPRVLTLIHWKDRLELITARLNVLSDGDPLTLAQKCRADNPNISLDTRLEVRYLQALRAELLRTKGKRRVRYIETVVAGNPNDIDDPCRRIFARPTRHESQDGETIDLYTKKRDRRFEPIPAYQAESAPPTRRRARKESP